METHRITQSLEPPSQPPESQLLLGTTLSNRYLIQGVLGVGGMGSVYRARDLHFPNVDKRVAVKEMIIQTNDPVVRETIVHNFEREANLLATLSHPSIPRIYDYFTQNERSYLILEFIDGKDLEALLADTTSYFPEQQVIQWAVELCDVLNYLHSHKPDAIVFRDMKPSNVMINSQGHVVLIDFGIAKPFQAGPKGTIIGTEGYSPPEQYRGEATPATDIYALGATLHHLLTRRDPRLEAPFSFSERPIRKINPQVSVELETVINTALYYSPENRFANILKMKEALLAAARTTGALDYLSIHSMPKVITAESDHIAEWIFECEDEVRGTPAVSSDVVYVGSYDNNLYALQASTGKFLWKYPTEGGIVSRPLIHENNVYIGSEDRRMHVINQRSGKLNWLYYTDGPVRSSPVFAEGHVFIGSDDGYLHAVNAMSGRRAWRSDLGAPIRSTPLIHQDLIYIGSDSGEFCCLDLGGTAKWRYRTKRGITSSAAISQNMVFFGSMDWTFYALDVLSGWAIWRFRLDKPSLSSPCIADNYIFTGAVDGTITCIDIRTGKEVWHYTTGNQVTGSPVTYQDSLYCGSVDGYLYCLEYRTGRLRWKFQTGGPITGAPAAGNNTIYVGSLDHRIYALPA